MEQWLATGGPAGEATRQVYAGYIRLPVLPALGSVPLHNVAVADMERWYAGLWDKGLSPASIRKAHTIVRAALAQAVRWGWVSSNVAALARPPLVPKAVVPRPTPAAIRRMLTAARNQDPELAVYTRDRRSPRGSVGTALERHRLHSAGAIHQPPHPRG
jgi:hypothetical protein